MAHGIVTTSLAVAFVVGIAGGHGPIPDLALQDGQARGRAEVVVDTNQVPGDASITAQTSQASPRSPRGSDLARTIRKLETGRWVLVRGHRYQSVTPREQADRRSDLIRAIRTLDDFRWRLATPATHQRPSAH
jgi:hypothetical protein